MFYLDSTAIYGYSSYEKLDYSSLEELLAEMDRLGVHAALTVNAVAARGHSLEGNLQLMEDLEACPAARDRILPVLAVAPKNFYEKESMAFFHEMLSSGRVGALAIYPVAAKFHVGQLERIFLELRQYRPVVLVDCEDLRVEMGYELLAELAAKFPEMSFVLRNSMWGDDGPMFDLLWRCKNVLVENSRLHENGMMRTIAEHFGADRLVYGRGYRSLSGASMASLAYSGLSAEEREQIAGKRLLSLLPNQKEAQRILAAAGDMQPKVTNRYWAEFVKGKGLSDVRIIDAHTHLGGFPSQGWYVTTLGFENALASFLARAKELGICHMITSGMEALHGDPLSNNRMLEEKTEKARDAVTCYYAYNPHYRDVSTEKELDERFASGGFVGFKILADYWKVELTDPRFDGAWSYADKHRLPVLFHCWGPFNTPEMIADIASRYPNATFIIGHSGGGEAGRPRAVRACLEHANVYLEYCGSFVPKCTWRQALDQVGAEKLIFGTDTLVHDQAWELGRLLSEDITDEELRLILSENIERILARRS